MADKIVLYPISVPKGKYCWEHVAPYSICAYFDNEGGLSNCTLRFDIGKDTPGGVLKAEKCLNLEEQK